MFHLMGTLSEYGKLGAVCIAPTREGSHALLIETVKMLHREAGRADEAGSSGALRGQRDGLTLDQLSNGAPGI